MSWLERFVACGMSVALIAVIAMNAKRAGRAVWLFAALPIVWLALMFLAFATTFIERARLIYFAIASLDAAGTVVAAIAILVACALLR